MARGEVMRSGSGRVVSLARRTDGLRVNGASRCGLRFRRRYPRTLTREARTEMRDEPLFAGTSNVWHQRRAKRVRCMPGLGGTGRWRGDEDTPATLRLAGDGLVEDLFCR